MLSKALFKLTLDHAPIGIQVLQLQVPGDVGSFLQLYVNDKACEMTGVDMKKDTGKTWREASPELIESSFAEWFESVAETGESVEWVYEYQDSRFSRAWWKGRAEQLDDQTIVIIFEDITEDKEAERALVEALDRLARSNAELDQFAYVASHDLKAPLRDLKHLASWIVEDLGEEVPEDVTQHVSRLKSRIEIMERLLDDLLAYSRAGRVDSTNSTFVLSQLLEEVKDSFLVPEGFEVVLPQTEVELTTSRVALSRVLFNLVDNALKHHDRDEGRIEIRFSQEGSMVAFEVLDDGPGINKEYFAQIFQMFSRLESASTGTGMGLAMVRKLVELHGGTIAVESEGRGSRFYFDWLARESTDEGAT